jgi:3-methyladenine DNA glycosylase AlkD
MKIMKLSKSEIDQLCGNVSDSISNNDYGNAVVQLECVLGSKVPFRNLDKIGLRIGATFKSDIAQLFEFIDQLVGTDAVGSYVIASSALIPLLEYDLDLVISKAEEIIIKGSVWYVCDSVAERVFGNALVQDFEHMLRYLEKLLENENKWINRSAGVAIHYFNKRVKEREDLSAQLLRITEPYIELKDRDIVKGLGWGIKTTGKYHPDLATTFLLRQLKNGKKLSKVLIKKAITYLPQANKEEIMKYVQGIQT